MPEILPATSVAGAYIDTGSGVTGVGADIVNVVVSGADG